jgi:hypothetical protein
MSKGGGCVNGLGPGMVTAKQVKELDQTPREKRPARSKDELLDSLNNWEQYVDPTNLEELLAHGISKKTLEEALRVTLYHNPTFASFHQAMRSKTMNPEKDAVGMYKELVQTYVRALKECLVTPENPGPIYESYFFAGKEVGTEIFDREPERQEELKKRREAP